MLWCIILLIRILGPNRREFNEMTTYGYVGKIKGTSREWCDIQGVEQQTWGAVATPRAREGGTPSAVAGEPRFSPSESTS